MFYQATLPLLPVTLPVDRPEAPSRNTTDLVRHLRKAAVNGWPIVLGTEADPYQPNERHPGITRPFLEAFSKVEGLELSITTRSPHILRDLELLTELDRRHAVTITVPIPAVDLPVARRLEPAGCLDPQVRLRTVRQLTAAGLATRILCTPIEAGINNGESVLRPLFEEAREAGAFDVLAQPQTPRPAPPLFSRLSPLYLSLMSRKEDPRSPEQQDHLLLHNFRRLRLEYGFPLGMAGRG
jgi:DNA repair photolyase